MGPWFPTFAVGYNPLLPLVFCSGGPGCGSWEPFSLAAGFFGSSPSFLEYLLSPRLTLPHLASRSPSDTFSFVLADANPISGPRGDSGQDPCGLLWMPPRRPVFVEGRLMASSFGDGCVSYFQAQSMVRINSSLMKVPNEMGKSCEHTCWPHTPMPDLTLSHRVGSWMGRCL